VLPGNTILQLSTPTPTVSPKGLFPLRLRVALRGERYRDADSVSNSLSPRNATRSRNGNKPQEYSAFFLGIMLNFYIPIVVCFCLLQNRLDSLIQHGDGHAHYHRHNSGAGTTVSVACSLRTTSGFVTSSVTWPMDWPWAISYRCSIGTGTVSPRDFQIGLKCIWVTVLTFLGHATSSVTCTTSGSGPVLPALSNHRRRLHRPLSAADRKRKRKRTGRGISRRRQAGKCVRSYRQTDARQTHQLLHTDRKERWWKQEKRQFRPQCIVSLYRPRG